LEGTAASDVMIPCTVTLRDDQTPDAARSLIERTGLGALAVVDESGGLQGIVTAERLASTAQDKPHARLADIIDRNVEVFDETTTFATLTGFFVANPSAIAVVVGDGKPLGFLTAAGIVDLAAPPEPCPANQPSWESHYLMLPDPAFASTDADWDEVPLSFSQHRG
ncbi:MAG: CBS domain-containing protein, partial [Thermoguttaceae bacterium]|nr:CBS domain-containing protein [Thermoguttaceae bacterium]